MPLALYALTAGAFGIGVTEFVIMGLLLDVSADLGVSIAAAGMLISGYALGVVVGAPVLTVLTARWPRKTVLLALMVIFIAGNAACALAPSYGFLMAARVLTALAHGTFFGVGAVVATGLVAEDRKASAIAVMFTGLTVANILGVPLGTWIGQHFGWRATFLAVTLVGLVAFAVIAALVPRDSRAIDEGDWRGDLAAILRTPVLLGLVTTVLGYAGVFAVFTYIAPMLTQLSGFQEAAVSPVLLVFGGGLVLGNLIGGKLADRNLSAAVFGTLIMLTLVLAAMTPGLHSPVATVVFIGLLGAAGFATVAPLQMWVLSKAVGAGQSLASSFNIAAFNLGNAIGAWAGGFVIDHGPGLIFVPLMAALFPAAAIAVATLATITSRSASNPCDPSQDRTLMSIEVQNTAAIPRARRKARAKRWFGALLAVAAMLFTQSTVAWAQDGNWIGTWTASPQPTWGADFAFPTKIPLTAKDQTFRQGVKISLGGSRLRLMFSNAYGDAPLKIGAVSVGAANGDGAVTADTIRKITFGGKDGIVVPPGAPVVSDPVDLTVADQAQLVVSTYLPEETPLKTFHWDGRETAWFADGDLTGSASFPTGNKTDARILLSEVLVDTPNDGSVVVIGDSITDGNGATVDADARWPDFLAKRLAPHRIAVLNAGISGARLLQDQMGVNAAARLDRNVFAQPDVKAVILLLGINDIAWPGTAFAPNQVRPTADAMIAGYQQVIALAHARNVRVVGATLTPFEGALSGTPLGDYYSAEKDALRLEINQWVRKGGAFDAVIDFDLALRDPAHPARLMPTFDSGDHLHPGDAGNEAMAHAVDLNALLDR